MKKKGQGAFETAGPAATLVAIIAGLILLYILFLPPDARHQLLEGNNVTGNRTSTAETGILVRENIGSLDYLSQDEIVHDIPSVTLYTKTEPAVLRMVDSMYLKNSIFSKSVGTIEFPVKDLENTNNLILSLTASSMMGSLIVTLNGKEIYNSELQSLQAPIQLPKDMIKEDNTIVLSASPVGWKFWQKNYFQLDDVKVLADVTDTLNSESKNVFIVSSTEKNNLEEVYLRFAVDCKAEEVSNLLIFINEYPIYDAIPDCGGMNPAVPIMPRYIQSGQNQLTFRASKGAYTIDNIRVNSKLQELGYPVFYFTLSDDQYYDIRDNQLDVNLTIEFVDDLEYKDALLVVNGIEIGIYQKERLYTRLLDPFVKKGSNAIEIIPKSNLDIVELKVELE